ncbi:MAG: hypothetical protein IJF15_05085 [Oscillospiraceae bacterium]|nr:hypothetical protein [Oscillospiraceae bacterium]
MPYDSQFQKESGLLKKYTGLRAEVRKMENEQGMLGEQERLTLAQKQQEFDALRENFVDKLDAEYAAWEQDQFQYRQQALAKDANDKAMKNAKSTNEIAEIREKRRQKQIKEDKKKASSDDTRHGFYKVVAVGVKFARWISGSDREERETTEEPTYQVNLKQEFERMAALAEKAINEGKDLEFEEKYGAYYRELGQKYAEAMDNKTLETATFAMRFSANQVSNVNGGTKPNATRYAQDGSKWLLKTNHSCIGAAAPNASLMTVAGYKVQKLVHPETAIEAIETKSAGQGTVSMQRMVDNVLSPAKGEVVDLFRFSRTPDALTWEEKSQVQQLAPQILREHTTDWLLANFDTKGENFIVSKKPNGSLQLRGIDKEAGGRAILDAGAQHMSKDYQRFDQDTVYNQLFRQYAAGMMDLDLHAVEAQVLRVEQCSDEEYLKIFEKYIDQQKRDRPDDALQIEKNLLRRKQTLRMEYRRFFGELVRERIKNIEGDRPDEAQALREKYFKTGEVFLFENDTAQSMKQERALAARLKEEEGAALEKKVEQADKKDEKAYNRRHALYDFSKGFVMGFKKFAQKLGFGAITEEEEERTVSITASDYAFENKDISAREALKRDGVLAGGNGGAGDDAAQVLRTADGGIVTKQTNVHGGKLIVDKALPENVMQQIEQTRSRFAAWKEQSLAAAQGQTVEERRAQMEAQMRAQLEELRMIHDEEIFLGGTKPMSQYIANDGSQWLAKQAVNCMGYAKPSGAHLTAVGANVQMLVDRKTAVQAFVGKTQKHGLVSFQRRLANVEQHKRDAQGNIIERKLDLFKFSRHPELATQKTVKDVEALMPQILREHVTDWVLCNFDTKGENFVITINEQGERVLHGIDKEAAFNKIDDPNAQVMSTTYKPHANNTLYNVVFEKFANAEMDFDLREVVEPAQKIIAMDDNEYLAAFEPYLNYLREEKGDEKADSVREKILARKTTLQETYVTFFTQLIERRCAEVHPDEAAELREKYLDGSGRFKFASPPPPAAEV